MSKIIDALEKAKKEGTLQHAAATLQERDTVAPVQAERAGPIRPPRNKNRSHAHLVVATEADPELARQVEEHVDVVRNPMSVISEQYRALRNRVERLNADGKVQTLAITSSAKGEGKSLTAANLALVMAQDSTKRVLLVDADLRRPKAHKLLGLELGPGLGDYFRGTPGDDIIRTTPFSGLCVTTAGNVEGHPSELLASPEFASWLSARRRDFDYIILDTPPLHPISDVNFLADTVDGILLVVRAGKTPKNLLKHAVESLPADKALGTILNRADSIGPRYGYGYGKGYYDYKYY